MAVARKATRAKIEPVIDEPAAPIRPEIRPVVREGVRPIAVGRDGNPIYLSDSLDEADPFAVAHLAPPGWVYEWKRYSVWNQVDDNYQANLRLRGHWTPVLAESHPGVFMQAEKSKGPIMRDGMILMERPVEVHAHFQALEKRKADEKIQNAKMQHGLASRSSGVATNTDRARQNTFIRSARDTGEDIPRPQYSYDPQSVD